MQPILLRNGTIIDGSGQPSFVSDVLISNGVIDAVGPNLSGPEDAREFHCAGLTITPGFIDSHSHSDLQVLSGKTDKVAQGVTAEVVGNCGFSPYPPADDPAALRSFANGIFCGDDNWGWPSSQAYLREAASSRTAHVSSLLGHGSLRVAVAGNKLGALPEADVQRMEGLLDDALAAGSVGFSTGLMYAPGSTAPFDELVRLCKVTARRGKIYTSHIRSYFSGLVPAIEEQIELARRAGCRLQISHLQAVGAANWDQQQPALDRIEAARNEGIDVAFDCYPYVAGSTVLTQLLPDWVLEGGTEGMMSRLTDPAQRKRAAQEIVSTIAWRWTDIYISAVKSQQNQECIGRNLQEIAEARGKEPVEVAFDLLVEERAGVNMLCFNQSEDNLKQNLQHPLSTIISDGFYVTGRPHPRLYGTFPLLLGTMSRKRGWLTLEEAVQKITSKPAERFGVEKRGRLAPGFHADVTVFDARSVDSPATYENPTASPVGIVAVFRNGELIGGDRSAAAFA